MELWNANEPGALSGAKPRQTEERRSDEPSLLSIAWANKGKVFLAGLASAVLAFLALAQLTPIYQSKTQIMLGANAAPVIDIPNVVADLGDNLASIESALIVMKSNAVLRGVANELELDKRAEFNPALREKTIIDKARTTIRELISPASETPEATGSETTTQARDPLYGTVRSLKSAVGVRVVGESRVIEISAESQDPFVAAAISNAVAEQYVNQQLEAKQTASIRATKWLEERAVDQREALEASEKLVAEFRSGLIDAGQEMSSDLELRRTEMTEQIVRLSTERADLLAQRDEIARLFAENNYATLASAIDLPAVVGLVAQLTEIDRQIIELVDRFGDHPKTTETREVQARVQQQLANEVQRAISGLEVRIGVLDDRLASLEDQLRTARTNLVESGRQELALRELEREAETSREVYTRFLLRLKEARERSLFQSPDARIVSEADAPLNPISPQKVKMSAIAGFGGSVLILAFFAYATYHRSTISDADDVRVAAGRTAVHKIPMVRNARSPVDVLRRVRAAPNSSVAEVFRWLQLRLLPKSNAGATVILVTSAGRGEGKSTLSLMLAETFGTNGYETILVNAESGEGGLLEFAASKELETSEFRYIDYSEQAIQMLEQTMALENGMRVRERALRQTDVIVIDGPAIPLSAGIIEIGRLADHVVVSCEWERTTRAELRQCADILNSAGVDISVVAINKVPEKAMPHYTPTGTSAERRQSLPPPTA